MASTSSGCYNEVLTVIGPSKNQVQTNDAEWICFTDLFKKITTANVFEVGCTYKEDVRDFVFMYRTDTFRNNKLLHIYVWTANSPPFKIGLSYRKSFIEESEDIMYMSKSLKDFYFNGSPKKIYYINTYNFSSVDIDTLKNKKLYMHVKICPQNILDCIELARSKSTLDFSSLLTDPVCSDFTIESADGHQYKVHKAILAVQSEVFGAMFKKNTLEGQNNYAKLAETFKNTMDYIIYFFYTGTFQDIPDSQLCADLLMFADQYNIKKLYNLTEYALLSHLCLDTVVDILILSDIGNSYLVKKEALKFIKQNPNVMDTSSWKELANPKLLKEICEIVMN